MNMHAKAIKSLISQHFSNQKRIWLLYSALVVLLLLILDTKTLDRVDTNAADKLDAQPAISEAQFAQMTTWPLFGEGATALQTMQDANIQLIGIIYEGDDSVAIVRIGGQEQFLKVGDKISGAYSIRKIEPLRVIITSNDGLEQLALFDNKQSHSKADVRDSE